VKEYDGYFQLKKDATGKLGLTSYQKRTTVVRMRVYGVVDDLVHEYMCMNEPTLYRFCKGVVHVFAREYLIETNVAGYCQSMNQEYFLVCLEA
jgi:predicted SpoU family rRNA methylase